MQFPSSRLSFFSVFQLIVSDIFCYSYGPAVVTVCFISLLIVMEPRFSTDSLFGMDQRDEPNLASQQCVFLGA